MYASDCDATLPGGEEIQHPPGVSGELAHCLRQVPDAAAQVGENGLPRDVVVAHVTSPVAHWFRTAATWVAMRSERQAPIER